MSVWEELGFELRLVFAEGEVEERFRERSQGTHPDSGGEEGVFERLREARNDLLNDFKRLELWLKAHGIEVSHSGNISPEIGEMFGRVGEVTSGVDLWVERGVTVNSGLGKALWQKEGFSWKTRVEVLIDEVDVWQEKLVSKFPALEEGKAQDDFAQALQVRAELGFLRKWRSELQTRFGKIWEGLV